MKVRDHKFNPSYPLTFPTGPDIGGPYGPYRQSERSELHRKHAQQLIDNGHAYRFCGITPASVQPTMASLEDLRTGARNDVPVGQLDCGTQSPPANAVRPIFADC